MTTPLRRLQVTVVPLAVLVLLLTALVSPAAAGKPQSGGGGACAVSPDPVSPGAEYTINGTGLGANRSVNVYVTGSGGTNSFFRYTDASGATSVTWYATWEGTNAVSVYSSGGRKPALLARCSFTVQ